MEYIASILEENELFKNIGPILKNRVIDENTQVRCIILYHNINNFQRYICGRSIKTMSNNG